MNPNRNAIRIALCSTLIGVYAIIVAPLECARSENDGGEKLPNVYENLKQEKRSRVEESSLFQFELAARKRFLANGPPDEIFLLAWSAAGEFLGDPAKLKNPRELLVAEIKGDRGVLRSTSDFGEKHTEKELGADDVKSIRAFVKKNDVDRLTRLGWTRIVQGKEIIVASGRIYVYLHLTAHDGQRIWIENPPTGDDHYCPAGDPLWAYSKIVDFFSGL